VDEPTPVVSTVAGSSNFYAAFSASQTGLLAYASSAASAELVWFDRNGQGKGSVGPPAEYVDFRLSPDDQQLALAEVDPQSRRSDIRVLDLVRGAKLRLTSDAVTDSSPVWSPDAKQIVFRSNSDGPHDLYQIAANGAARSVLLCERSGRSTRPTGRPPDGRSIVYHTYQRDTGADIWMASADGSHVAPLVQTPFDEMQGQVSSDGRWLAYTSHETDQAEVYIRSLSDAGTRWQVSAGGGTDPRWRRDARELFYVSADSWLTSVGFVDGASITAPPVVRDPRRAASQSVHEQLRCHGRRPARPPQGSGAGHHFHADSPPLELAECEARVVKAHGESAAAKSRRPYPIRHCSVQLDIDDRVVIAYPLRA
jgi:protease II